MRSATTRADLEPAAELATALGGTRTRDAETGRPGVVLVVNTLECLLPSSLVVHVDVRGLTLQEIDGLRACLQGLLNERALTCLGTRGRYSGDPMTLDEVRVREYVEVLDTADDWKRRGRLILPISAFTDSRRWSKRIEAALLRIPLAPVWCEEDALGRLVALPQLDSTATLRALLAFLQGWLVLDLPQDHPLQGMKFADLEPHLQNRLGRTRVTLHVVEWAQLGAGLANFVGVRVDLRRPASASAKMDDKGGGYTGALAVAPGVWLYQLLGDSLAAELTAKGTKYYKDDDLN